MRDIMLKEIYEYLEKSETIYDFADAVVVVRLRQTRDMYIEELDRLDKLPILNDAQVQDYEELAEDVVALDRIIKMYHFDEDNND